MQQKLESLETALTAPPKTHEVPTAPPSTIQEEVQQNEEDSDSPSILQRQKSLHSSAIMASVGMKSVDGKENDKGNGSNRRYVVSCGVKQDGQEVRLHGRWMELSTQRVDNVSVAAVAARKSKKKTIKKRGSSDLFPAVPRGLSGLKPIQPASTFRLLWDALGFSFILVDAFTLPVIIAWGVSDECDGQFGRCLLRVLFLASMCFWMVDVPLNFNTAVYLKGELVTQRYRIARHYVRTWLSFDIALIVLDVLNLSPTEMGRWEALRYARIIRAFRLLRLLKMSKLQDILQEMAASTGRQWIMLVIAIVNTSGIIIVVAHVLTCLWWGLGKFVDGDESIGYNSWIVESNASEAGAEWIEYLHALRYVINAPSPPTVAAASGAERLFDILAYIFSLVVIGSAVSAIASTLNELKAMNEASARQRREIRIYLTSQSASFELVSRIMKFVDYKLKKMSFATFDPALISTTLQTELFVGQRSRYLKKLPIFALCDELFSDVFASICAAMTKQIYEQKEYVFTAGSWNTHCYISTAGVFSYVDGFDTDAPPIEIQGEAIFAELSLYAEATMHQATLTATTFGEMFVLKGHDLADCVRESPGCTSMFCEYAKEYINAVKKKGLQIPYGEQEVISRTCCKVNQCYQILYPNPDQQFANISVAAALKQQHADGEAILRSRSLEVGKLNSHNTERSDSPSRIASSLSDPDVAQMLEQMQEEGLDDARIEEQLQSFIPELHVGVSPHVVFEQAAERDRAESACISLLALLHDRYDIFTQPQAPGVRLREDQWRELQDIVALTSSTIPQVHAVLVLLSIRGLGKSKAVLNQVPRSMKRPERAVVHLMTNHPNVVPSVSFLDDTYLHCAQNCLFVHETFNLAQMLQGENVPANVDQLQQLVHKHGKEVFYFYVLFLLGFMSGIAGGHGSRFMNARNAEGFIAGLNMLRHVFDRSPQDIYWGYLASRAHSLRLPSASAEDLVMVRLACLSRVQDADAYWILRSSWEELGEMERKVLTEHFLADGLEMRAFVLEFLPACVANARSNGLVGLTLLLEVLVELLHNLRPAVNAVPEAAAVMMLPVDLSDMGEFIAAVQNRFVFKTCVSRCAFRFSGTRVLLEMTGGNWGRVNDPDTDLTSIAYDIKDILMKQQHVEKHMLRRNVNGAHPS